MDLSSYLLGIVTGAFLILTIENIIEYCKFNRR